MGGHGGWGRGSFGCTRNLVSSADYGPAAITLALLTVAWIRSGEAATAEERAPA